MSPGDQEFLQQLRATFRVEAAEHLQSIARGLIELEKPGGDGHRALVETIYRAAHSLKGAARAVDFTDIESLCQSLESLFAAWKRAESAPSAPALDTAHRALDQMVAAIEPPGIAAALPLAAGAPARANAPPPAVRKSPDPTTETRDDTDSTGTQRVVGTPAEETVRVPVRALDERLLESEEMLAAKIAANQRATELNGLAAAFEQWRSEWSRVQGDLRALPGEHHGLSEFLEWNHDWLRALESRVASVARSAEQDRHAVDKLVNDLLENSKKLLMLPIATITAGLPKVVRDLTRELGKEADLVIRGDEVRIDKRILEEMKDPLVHLLRNCVDHGIEVPDVRRAAGKPARATITLAIAQGDGNQVDIAVHDDGAGVDVEQVRAQAVTRGLLSVDAARNLDDAAVLRLVFETDLSTSPMITQLSGRGLGLAIVREKAEKLGGHVDIESAPRRGTTIRMTLPLTIATFRGVLVRAARHTFVVPTAQVERVTRFTRHEVRTVEGRETLAHNGRALALADLSRVLQLPAIPREAEPAASPALILGSGAERIAFAVDAVLDEREVLVKRFAKPLARVRNIAGATVLGNGEVAPILNVTDLLKAARRAPQSPRTAAAPRAALAAKRVLVAEDSITSRMLIKGILESAGYEVKTAVDGIDAYTLLRSEKFDVLVSDVEMPRLNGFDLAARVRADAALGELPIILVTALASREDRERGIEVGASAYLVKSNLDQSNLLEALRRLA